MGDLGGLSVHSWCLNMIRVPKNVDLSRNSKSIIFLHKQVHIMGQLNDKNYIDGQKGICRTSEQLTATHINQTSKMS